MNNYEDYSGYEWGWIIKDGTRQDSGREAPVLPDEIAGIWSVVKYKNIEIPSYHEIFLEEYKKSEKGSWGERPMTMLLKLMRIQAHTFARNNEVDLPSLEDEIVTLPILFAESTKKLQLWKCKKCGHTFYTPLEEKQVWYLRIRERFLGVIGRPVYTNCQVCSELKSVKVKIVTKKIQG